MPATAMKQKPFSWSYTKLKNFRNCPKRHWHVDIQKEFKDESDALTWGNQVHDALAARIGKGIQLPRTMVHYDAWAANILDLKAKGWTIKVEQKLAMNQNYQPRSFFDGGVWFRGVIDVLALGPSGKRALAFDWKTGAIKVEIEQLGLFAQLVFAHYPDVDQVGTSYIWLPDADKTEEIYRHDGMLPLWNSLAGDLATMEVAWRTTTYPAKPSGLCKNYCPVTSCPYHGRGDR